MTGADRLAIQDLIATYADIVDNREFDRFAEVFTPDARIDFTAFGGPVGSPADIAAFLADSLGVFRRTQHMMGLPRINVDGDHATARTPCHNPMVLAGDDGNDTVLLIGLWYDDELVRTADGWRVSGRRQERSYSIVGMQDTALGPG